MARDLLFFLSGNNLNFVCGEPQRFKSFRGRRPNVVAVLSDAAGEDDNIYTAQQAMYAPIILRTETAKTSSA